MSRHVTIVDGPLALCVMCVSDDSDYIYVPVRKDDRRSIAEYRSPGPSLEHSEVRYRIVPFRNGSNEKVWLGFVQP